MGFPRISSARDSALWVSEAATQDVTRLLMLIILLRLYLPDGTDFVQVYRRYRSRASQFFDDCVSGKVTPVRNKLQAILDATMVGQSVAHLYIRGEPGSKASYFVSLFRAESGMWRLRHRKIRLAPEPLVRDGIFASWSNDLRHPDVVCAQMPRLERVITGGLACATFAEEANGIYEVGRQLTQICAVCQVFGCLPRNEIVTWHEPGRVVLRADMGGNPWTQPYEFKRVACNPYAWAGTTKARVIVHARASDAGLYTVQPIRSLQATFKGVSGYAGRPHEPTEKLLLGELLLSRLIPLVGVDDGSGTVNLFGLHYDLNKQQGVIGQMAAGRSQRSVEGLPRVRLEIRQSRRIWIPNPALLSILRDLLYDPSPDEEARLDRWYALTRVFGYFGIPNAMRLTDYFSCHNTPLPDGAENHIKVLEAALKGQ